MNDPLNRSTLTGLRTFSAFAESGNVTRAAELLHVTPGAVSQQLKQLEDLLDTPLIAREGKRLELTPAGHKLATQLHTSFSQIRSALLEAQHSAAHQALRVKLMPSLAICWLLPHLASFYEKHPSTALDIVTVPTTREATLDGADLAVCLGRGDWPGLSADLLFADALLPVCSPALAKRLKKPTDLHRQTLLHSAMRPDAWSIWFEAQDTPEPQDTRAIRFSNAALAYQAAMSGVGVAIAQYPYVRQDLAAGRLAAPFAQPVSSEQGYYLVRRRARSGHKDQERFRRWILSLGG